MKDFIKRFTKYIVVSLLAGFILSFIPYIKGFFPSLIIQGVINIYLCKCCFPKIWNLPSTSSKKMMFFSYGLISSVLEFILVRQILELDFPNFLILIVIFCLVCFAFLNDKIYLYLQELNPVGNFLCDLLTLLVLIFSFFILESHFKGNVPILVNLFVLIVSSIIYWICNVVFTKEDIKQSFLYLIGELTSFFLLLSLLISAIELINSKGNFITVSYIATVYTFFLFIRMTIIDKMKMSEDDKGTFVFSVLLVLFYCTPVYFILLRDYSSKQASGVMGLTLIIWGIPKIFTFLQEKIYSYLAYDRQKEIKIAHSKDAITSIVNINVFIALLVLSFSYPNKFKFSLEYGDVANNVMFSFLVGILGTFFVIAITYFFTYFFTFLFASCEKKFRVCIMYICSFLIVYFSLILINYFSKGFSEKKDILDLMKWSLLLFVPIILKKMPVILDFISRGRIPKVLEGKLYGHFCNVTEINLFITVLILYFILYFQLSWDINNNLSLLFVVLAVYVLVHFLIFVFSAEKLQVGSRDSRKNKV